MRRRKQSRQMKKASVAALVKRIDGVIDAYEKSGRGIVSISFSPEGKRLAAMLKELEKYHPLDVRVRKHGNKLYQRLFDNDINNRNPLLIELEFAFEVPHGHSPFRWYCRQFHWLLMPIYAVSDVVKGLLAMVIDKS